jgi:hypothetical protein
MAKITETTTEGNTTRSVTKRTHPVLGWFAFALAIGFFLSHGTVGIAVMVSIVVFVILLRVFKHQLEAAQVQAAQLQEPPPREPVTAPAPLDVAPGWYPDPAPQDGIPTLRWWDGSGWADNVISDTRRAS